MRRLSLQNLESRRMLAADPMVFDADEVDWYSNHKYSQDEWVTLFNELKSDFIPTDIEADVIGGDVRYGATWQRNTEGRDWQQWHQLTSTEFADRWQEFNDQGFRLVDQETYTVSGQTYYSGLWIENTEGYRWASYRNLTTEEFSQRFSELRNEYMIIDVESYGISGQQYYSMVWVENVDNRSWVELRDMSPSGFEQRLSEFEDDYRVLEVESYLVNGQQRYAAIWVDNPSNRGWFYYYGMTDAGWYNRWTEMRDLGFRPVDYEAYQTSAGTRYAGVWRQNDDRVTWEHREELDALGESFISSHDLVGAGVTVISDSETLYRNGFGFQDENDGKWYSTSTINRLASISKTVAGALSLDLVEDAGFNLDQPTRQYETTLPSHHTHTPRQILSVRSGIGHYSELGQPASSAHFDRARDAMQFFVGEPLVHTPGTDCHYSTHGYTVLGSAIERHTGMPIADVVESRITEAESLPTLKAEDRSEFSEFRSAVYDSSGVERAADDISWKVLGGGLEASNFDLARFGAKLIDGDIISASSLQELFTAPPPTDCSSHANFGLGLSTWIEDGHQVAQMTGSQLGAGTALRMYPDLGIVIAVTSNVQGADAFELAGEVADVILPPSFDDAFEPNDTLSSAAQVSLGADNSWQGAGRQFDNDYFEFELPAESNVEIEALFSHAEGDIDFELFDESESLIAGEYSITDNESYATTLTAGTYYVLVFGPSIGTEYDLLIDATPVTSFFSYHNASLPEDVNDDGIISPIDALLVINYLTATGGGELPLLTSPPSEFLDVTDDGFASPLDALLVINRLNTAPALPLDEFFARETMNHTRIPQTLSPVGPIGMSSDWSSVERWSSVMGRGIG